MNCLLDFINIKNTFLFWLVFCIYSLPMASQILPGADNTTSYLPELKGKKIGVVAHQASLVISSGEYMLSLIHI